MAEKTRVEMVIENTKLRWVNSIDPTRPADALFKLG
jgi:hypothetical protein